MDETIYVIFKVQFDFALEVWFSIFHSVSFVCIDCFVYEPVREISNNVVCATSKTSDQPAHTRSPIRAFASRLNIL